MSDYLAFDPLLSRYFEGAISREELTQLEEKLLADEDFARYVSRWCMMHRQIADLLTEKQLHQLMDQFATRSPALRQEIFNKPVVTQARGLRPNRKARSRWFASMGCESVHSPWPPW